MRNLFLVTEDEKMSMYIENNLTKDERVVMKAQKSWLYLLMPAIWLVLIFVLAIVAQVYISKYTSHEGLYVEISTAEKMSEFDSDSRSLSESEKEQWITLYNEENPETPVSNWSAFRKKVEEQYRQQYRDEWAEEGEALFERTLGNKAEAEEAGMGFFQQLLVNGGTYVNIVLWVLFILIGILPFVRRLLLWLSINLALTNKRIVGKVGILRVNSLDFHLDKIDHVQIKASLFGNLFHYYTLRVVSVGGAGFDNGRTRTDKDTFVGISNAQEFKDMATRAIELHAEEARKAQAEEIARAMGK